MRLGRIPRYLKERKLQLLKRKILLRKFAYLFYRKTISPILPSIARKYYLQRIKISYFNLWRELHFEEKLLWRLIIRANIHYNLNLKRNCFKKLQLYVINKKEKALKLRISENLFNRKIKKKYFLVLYYSPKLRRAHEILVKYLNKYLIFLYLNYHINRTLLKLNELQEKLLLIMYVKKLERKRLLKSCLRILMVYKNWQVKKRENQLILKKYLESKYNSEYLMPYFQSWIQYVVIRIQKKSHYEEASVFYLNKLLRDTFNSIKKYKEMSLIKKELKLIAFEFLKRKLLFKTFNGWKKRIDFKIKMHNLMIEAELFYWEKLTRDCFKKLKLYFHHKNVNRQKIIEAEEFYSKTIVKRIMIIWKNLLVESRERKLRISKLKKLHEFYLSKKYLKYWRLFIEKKKANYLLEKQSLMKNTFCMWKKFSERCKLFRILKEEAWNLYKKKLIHEGLRIILIAGLERKRCRENMACEVWRKQFYLSTKYFKIWKSKVLFIELSCDDFLGKKNWIEAKVNNSMFEEFNWNPFCFEKPRVPEYLRSECEEFI